jgi:hypothetical protein
MNVVTDLGPDQRVRLAGAAQLHCDGAAFC